VSIELKGLGYVDAFTASGAYLGTNHIGRALTDRERDDLQALLVAHDFVGASKVALLFAQRLRRSVAAAQDLLARASLRLVRTGWDPRDVELKKRLCRLVWSEHANERRAAKKNRGAEEVFLREQVLHGEQAPPAATKGEPLGKPSLPEHVAPSPERLMLRFDEEREDDEQQERRLARMREDIERLRVHFREKDDAVNLAWLDLFMQGTQDPAAMARETGRDVQEFYAATKRRARAVRMILGVSDEENR
jgi:hypothetical protein